ncbi:hypothetical protein Syun_014139 [Stephania yunnanensis]|uniref:Uncharacterized protein n=1 Tax=Stephania yunnanensis TaxID=152371 RepID=A0AAP0JJ71_9MAGN
MVIWQSERRKVELASTSSCRCKMEEEAKKERCRGWVVADCANSQQGGKRCKAERKSSKSREKRIEKSKYEESSFR